MATKKGGPALVVQSKIKDVVKKAKMKCSSDVVDALTRLVHSSLLKGVERAKANGRKTLRGADL
jgi:histone H3/H4